MPKPTNAPTADEQLTATEEGPSTEVSTDEPVAAVESAPERPSADAPEQSRADELAPEQPAAVDRAPKDSAADEPGVKDSAPDAGTVPSGRRRPSRRPLLVAGLTALLLMLWAAGGWLFAHNRATQRQAEQRAAALAVAQQVATDLTTIDGQSVQDQVNRLTQVSTGAFREQIGAYATALEAILRQAKAGSRGTVSAAGIERIDDSTAAALVTVNGVVTNNKVPNGARVTYRLDVQLRRAGDRWLASDVRFLP